jgi:hypothetical protein
MLVQQSRLRVGREGYTKMFVFSILFLRFEFGTGGDPESLYNSFVFNFSCYPYVIITDCFTSCQLRSLSAQCFKLNYLEYSSLS